MEGAASTHRFVRDVGMVSPMIVRGNAHGVGTREPRERGDHASNQGVGHGGMGVLCVAMTTGCATARSQQQVMG